MQQLESLDGQIDHDRTNFRKTLKHSDEKFILIYADNDKQHAYFTGGN